jgi:hypothetical protein
MSDKPTSSFIKSFFAAVFIGFFTYLVFPVISSIVSAYINQDARFDPQRGQSPVSSPSSSAEIGLPTPKETVQTPSSTSIQTPKPEPTISGEWEGKYTCSKQVTGVTIAIVQTGNKVIAEFSLGPVPESPNIPRGIAKYEGDFNPISRRMSFPRGTWIEQPAPFWTAFGFQGQFNENLETFSGKMDHHSCTTINLRRKSG